ncbi:MAG: molybdopterin synthase sulfur carrier subunit [Chloroflexi bacterium]|nr:molybdopterin synthase sulfur carrier subunit [Chloroflexota bacterium]|tara:strand:- start:15983 stop:16276 length:294 start_codon:yes stop_codon:yes gene_type:complete
MNAVVIIPSPLRNLTNGERKVNIKIEETTSSVEKIIVILDKLYPGILTKVLDEDNQLHKYVNIFLDGEDIRYLDGVNTNVSDEGELSIVPAVAGGLY